MRNKKGLPRNPVKHHMHKSVQASVEPDKKRLKQSDAILRDVDQIVFECQFDSETVDIDGMSWGERDILDWQEACEHPLSCVGCSNLEIDCEED